MHEVHTLSRFVVPPPAGTRTVWMFGSHRRLVRRCEWDTLWPKPGPLPQTSHTLATGISWGFDSIHGPETSGQPVKGSGSAGTGRNPGWRPACDGCVGPGPALT